MAVMLSIDKISVDSPKMNPTGCIWADFENAHKRRPKTRYLNRIIKVASQVDFPEKTQPQRKLSPNKLISIKNPPAKQLTAAE